MEKMLQLMDEGRKENCYARGNYKDDILYAIFHYLELRGLFGFGRSSVKDGLADRLLEKGKITSEQAEECQKGYQELAQRIEGMDDWPLQKIYGEAQAVRRRAFGVDVMESDKLERLSTKPQTAPEDGLWQKEKKTSLIREKKAALFALCDPAWAGELLSDVKAALEHGTAAYLAVSTAPGGSLFARETLEGLLKGAGIDSGKVCFVSAEEPWGDFSVTSVHWDESLARAAAAGEAALIVYGETGFLQCIGLNLDSFVCGTPTGFITQAMVNQIEQEKACQVFVPAHFDISRTVRLSERTRLSYWQLGRLWQAYGDTIYSKSVKELYIQYPQYFLNVYENGPDCPEAKEDYPIRVRWPEDTENKTEDEIIGEFLSLKDKSVKDFVKSQEGLSYVTKYFDEGYQEQPVPWYSPEQQKGILVQGITVHRAKKSKVLQSIRGETIRERVKEEGVKDGVRYYTNFLFFFTPSLVRRYNDLRADRPEEQLPEGRTHLDYLLEKTAAGRKESFPLFDKAAMALKDDGSFLFFRFRLGAGKVTVGGHEIAWEAKDVDPEAEERPVVLYTPHGTVKDGAEETWSYRKIVGEGRVNLIFIQDELTCVRKGGVVQPSVGVVVSLDEKKGEEFLTALKLTPGERGYCDCRGLKVSIELQHPSTVPKEDWDHVLWSYGGGLSLISDGHDLYENGEAGAIAHMTEEGWMSPMSRQTQESEVHKLDKHPRTAVGVTESGDFFVLVYSGRVPCSSGADYAEMCTIAHKMVPNIRSMMNVDGGASSVMGLDIGGSFMEISYPSTTGGNAAGMARPIYSTLRLEQ